VREAIDGAADTVPKGIDGSVSHFSQRVFELGENLFDRIEVRAVGRRKALRRPGGFDARTPATL
jgi:hypothetical protein